MIDAAKPVQTSNAVYRVMKAIEIEPYIRAGDAHFLYAAKAKWPDYRQATREEYWHLNAQDSDKKSDADEMSEARLPYTPAQLDDYLPAMRLARLIYSNRQYDDHWQCLIWHGQGASYAAIGLAMGFSKTTARNRILDCYRLIDACAEKDGEV